MSLGERLHKDLYEALRAGPGWNRTLFLILYDDAGGIWDSVVPPTDIPSDDAPCNVDPGCARTGAGPAFDFKVISPLLRVVIWPVLTGFL